MEPDPPLIGIADEDDTFISSLTDTSALASPLLSPIARIIDKSDAAKSSSSSASDNNNKENININKSELTKLSVEPQQMKRRKRGGAYNLRKSLAWDKAFSTDEGFLNPSELSMLGGSNNNTCRELLPSISEDKIKFSCSSYSKGDPSDLHGTPKVMSNKKCSSSGSKSRCPRPLFSPSLKRPANSSIQKAEAKESKLPKLPVSKLDAHSLQKASKSNFPSTSRTKDNQIGREDIQKVARSQSTSKSTRTSIGKHKFSFGSVSVSEKSRQQPKRNTGTSAGKLFSSSDLQPQQPSVVTRADSGHKATSAALPPSGSFTADSYEMAMKNRAFSEKVSLAMTRSHTEVQSRKPSGLRMPSPSLGFFSQPKFSSSNSLPQRANILNSTYPSRLPRVPTKLVKKVENNSSTGNSEVSGSSLELLSSSNASVTPKLANNSVLVKEKKGSDYARSVSKQKQVAQRITGCGNGIEEESENSCKVQKSSFGQHMDLQKKDNHLFMEDTSSDQLKKDGNKDIVDSFKFKGSDNIHLENNFDSHITFQEAYENVRETNDAIHCQHEKDNKFSSSTVVHGTIFESLSESSAGVFNEDYMPMTLNDDSKATIDDIVDSFEFKGSDNIHLENNFDSHITFQEAYENVRETNDAIHCQHEEDNKFSSSTVVHGTIFESLSESSAGVFNEDYMPMTLNDDSKATTDVVQWETEKTESPNIIMMAKPVRKESVLLEDKYFIFSENVREDFTDGASKLCESKRNEILCSMAPPHTTAEQVNQEVNGFDHGHDKYTVAYDGNVSLLVKSEAADKSDEVHALETCSGVNLELNRSDVITENQCLDDDDEIVVTDIFEDVSLSNAKEMNYYVKDGHCSIDFRAKPGRLLETKGDHESSELFYKRKEDAVGSNDLENKILPEKAETEDFSDKGYLENEKTMVEDRKNLHQYHTREHERITHLSSTDPSSAGSCQISFSPLITYKVDTSETGVLFTGDPLEFTFSESTYKPLNSTADNLDSVVFPDTKVVSGQPPEMHTPTLAARHICDENHPWNGCTFVCTCREGREGNCLPTALTVQKQTDINQVRLSVDGSGVHVEGIDEKTCVGYDLSGSISTETLTELDDISLDTVTESSMVHSDQATYTEPYVAAIAGGSQTCDLIDTCGQSCSGEISSFIDQKIQALPECINVVDTRVDEINSASPADIEANIPQEYGSLITECYHDQGSSDCSNEDGNASLSIKRPEGDEMVHNLTIKPPANAIPFSDEWLAAMEAAGEEILTMKRGAVQNSPTDKALPEPSPWSPVKKKQNQIGPYDCTKFINVPLNSD